VQDKLSSPPVLRVGGRHSLVKKLKKALEDYDRAYEDCIIEWPKVVDLKTGVQKPDAMTEERLKIATRNKMREREQDFPELVRWDLRMAVGFRSEEE
jgi:hypothetical protein